MATNVRSRRPLSEDMGMFEGDNGLLHITTLHVVVTFTQSVFEGDRNRRL